jgi:hypothetical protein
MEVAVRPFTNVHRYVELELAVRWAGASSRLGPCNVTRNVAFADTLGTGQV